MRNRYYYQVLASLSLNADKFQYSRRLNDILKAGELVEVDKFVKGLSDEIENTNISAQQSFGYFRLITEMGLMFALHRGDFKNFFELSELIGKKLQYLSDSEKNAIVDPTFRMLLDLLDKAGQRIARQISLEDFNEAIDELEWNAIEKDAIYKFSGLIGYVFLL